jgi:hypothetical protein
MCLKCRGEITNPFAWVINLMDDDFGIAFELSLFASNIKKNVCGVLDSFLSFKKDLKKKRFITCL